MLTFLAVSQRHSIDLARSLTLSIHNALSLDHSGSERVWRNMERITYVLKLTKRLRVNHTKQCKLLLPVVPAHEFSLISHYFQLAAARLRWDIVVPHNRRPPRIIMFYSRFLSDTVRKCIDICVCMYTAGHSSRSVWSMNCLRSLWRWDRGFESHLKTWMFGLCMRLFCVCVVLCVGRALQRADHSPKESYRLWKMITELNKRPGPWIGWKNHWKKLYIHLLALSRKSYLPFFLNSPADMRLWLLCGLPLRVPAERVSRISVYVIILP
jgi:hypothetical protein